TIAPARSSFVLIEVPPGERSGRIPEANAAAPALVATQAPVSSGPGRGADDRHSPGPTGVYYRIAAAPLARKRYTSLTALPGAVAVPARPHSSAAVRRATAPA